jgi:hypothetical protein
VKHNIPLISRLICKFLWHSYRGVINDHGVLWWLVCTRCGDRRTMSCGGWKND